MIKRILTNQLKRLAKQYPIVTVIGPRQSGKTTLCQKTFPKYQYISLENLDQREFANSDPRGFLAQYGDRLILDEIQRCPDLPSYLQSYVDAKKTNGLFVLTGSQHFSLTQTINQSLAGRTALLRLLPFSIEEIVPQVAKMDVEQLLWTGFYPRIYDQKLKPSEAMDFYLNTYVEKDIRSLANIQNLTLFEKFLGLCAGRVGQLLNLTALGNETGISHTTAQQWMSLLEASFIVFRLPPFFRNLNKRLVKSPKLYFYDVGLASHLLGIHQPEQLNRHPLSGALFENLVIADILKNYWHRAISQKMSFYRDNNQNEIDLILESGQELCPIEIKSAQTITESFFKALNYFQKLNPKDSTSPTIIYAGAENLKRQGVRVLNYRNTVRVLRNL